MRITAIVLLILAASVQLAAAQTPTLCIYSDAAGTQCSFDDVVGLNSFYIFLIDAPGAAGVEFSAPRPVCMTGSSWLADEKVWDVTVGTSQDGVSVGFGACLSGPIHVLTVYYSSTGIVEQDCAYPIEPIIGQPAPRYVDCQNDFQTAGTGSAYINSTLGCDCNVLEPVPVLEVSPTSLRFAPDETQKTLSIHNAGPGVLEWSVSSIAEFMSFNPQAGTGDADVLVTIDRSGINTTTLKTLTVDSNGGSVTIQVTVEVGPGSQPSLAVSPSSLSFAPLEVEHALDVINTAGGILDWSIAASEPWVTVNPASGSNTTSVTVTVDRSGLAAGTYTDVLQVSSNGGGAMVPVTMEVITDPVLEVTPLSLDFPPESSQASLLITNVGVGTLSWSAASNQPWLIVTPASGSREPGEAGGAVVTIDRTSLTDGTYYGQVDFTSNGGSATVDVTMEVLTSPVLDVAPASLSFPFNVGQMDLYVTNVGVGTLSWSIVPDASWVSVSPAAGSNTAGVWTRVTVSVDRSTLADGNHTATLNVTSNGGNAAVPVSVDVLTTPVLSVIPTGVTLNQNNPIKNFQISNAGAGTLEWSISENEDWLSVSPASGTGYAIIQVIADLDLVPEGSADAVVSVTSNGGNAGVDVFWRPITGGSSIGVFQDTGGLDPCIEDDTAGLRQIHVVHFNTVGATASRFSAPVPACWVGATYLSDTAVFGVTIGNSQTGVSVGYGTCLAAPIHVLTINVFGLGLTGQTCCPYTVLPDPDATTGEVEVVNCQDELVVGSGFTSFVSAPPCNCSVAVRVEETTWGRIKAMYLDGTEAQRLLRRP